MEISATILEWIILTQITNSTLSVDHAKSSVLVSNQNNQNTVIYPYKLLSDVSGPLISGKPHISGHKFPCSMNKENIFSDICSELFSAQEKVPAWVMDEIRDFMYLPRATGTISSMHNENCMHERTLMQN